MARFTGWASSKRRSRLSNGCATLSTKMEEWIKVGSAPNETSALMMQGLLEEAGIPALIQRGAGFDVPDFLSAGPRDILVPDLVLKEAREILNNTTGLGSWVS